MKAIVPILCFLISSSLFADDIEALKAKAEKGDAKAQFNLGLMYANGRGVEKDEGEAVKWYRKAAEQNLSGAQYELGYAYGSGQGVEKDEKEASKWYRKAAEQGDAGAQFFLGMMYANGEGVEKDGVQAVKWYRKAAEQGFSGAQNNLGLRHEKGEGVEQDDKEAVKWYRKAAEQGLAIAQNNLGMRYGLGLGVQKDPVEAFKWILIAAENGYTGFEQTRVAVDMSPAQIAKAYNLAKQSLGAKGRKLNLTYSYWNHVRLLIASTLGNVPEGADLKEVIKAARNFNNAVDQLSVQEIDEDATDAVLACTAYFQKQIAILSTVPSDKQRIVKGAILGALFDFKGIADEIKGELETGRKLVADWAEVKIQLRKNRVNLSRKHKRDFPPLFSN